jgi:predicted nucleic acid-binding protein
VLVDTCFCIDLLREQDAPVEGAATVRLSELDQAALQIPVFVLCELEAGARSSAHPERELRRVMNTFGGLSVVHTDERLPAVYGELEVVLRRAGTPIPSMDLLIGSMAVRHSTPLLTRDVGHYDLIPGLVVETY